MYDPTENKNVSIVLFGIPTFRHLYLQEIAHEIATWGAGQNLRAHTR